MTRIPSFRLTFLATAASLAVAIGIGGSQTLAAGDDIPTLPDATRSGTAPRDGSPAGNPYGSTNPAVPAPVASTVAISPIVPLSGAEIPSASAEAGDPVAYTTGTYTMGPTSSYLLSAPCDSPDWMYNASCPGPAHLQVQ